MTSRVRTVAVAALAGLVAAFVSVVGGVWLAGVLDDEPPVDGEFVLDQPGVFEQPTDEVNADATGERLPAVALTDAAGNPVALDAHRGTPMIVNLWYSFCPPCARELGDFAAVDAELGDRVRFVGVNPFDPVETMERFAGERGVTYELLRDAGREFSIELGIVAYPVTLFVDAEGRIVRQTGELGADELQRAIDELFPGIAT
jgi:peroxiredoxin